jgi:hypothetical protein
MYGPRLSGLVHQVRVRSVTLTRDPSDKDWTKELSTHNSSRRFHIFQFVLPTLENRKRWNRQTRIHFPRNKICLGAPMDRDRGLKVVLIVVGLIFCALLYPLIMFTRQEPALAMMLSVYVTLGIFLLLAARDPPANRSLIAFTAWSSLAHAALMGFQAFRNLIARGELIGVAVLTVIGVALIVMAPSKTPSPTS